MNLRLYFIAIVAPKPIDEFVRTLKEEMRQQYGCKAALKSPAHITLVPPFKMQEETEKSLREAIDRFTSEQEAFEVQLRNFSAFQPRVIYVDVVPRHQLSMLHKNLNEALFLGERFGITPEQRQFNPHITIATRDLRKEDFPEAWARFSKEKYEAKFAANEIALLRNTPGRWDIIHQSKFNTNQQGG